MRLLVLGGTAWLGGVVAATALRRGHQVTCLARGTTGAPPPGARLVAADRDRADAYAGLAGTTFDAVVDVARQPGQVRGAAAALAGRAGRFLFVSTVNVYADLSHPGDDDSAPLLPAQDAATATDPADYGRAKVACEQAVLDAFGAGACLVVRPGLIAGPGDVTGRTGYWPLRFARPARPDGAVLVPDTPDQPTQLLDVRDLAGWLVTAAETGLAGIFDAVGPTVSLAEHLATARAVAGHTGAVVAAGSDWLLAHQVQPWMGQRSLPLWLPIAGYAGLPARSGAAARAAGLAPRPLAETLADTLAWELSRSDGIGAGRGAGLTDPDERDLLATLTAG